jgi:hypothetical protein
MPIKNSRFSPTPIALKGSRIARFELGSSPEHQYWLWTNTIHDFLREIDGYRDARTGVIPELYDAVASQIEDVMIKAELNQAQAGRVLLHALLRLTEARKAGE